MKKLLSIGLLLAALHVQAQGVDRTKAPEPLPAPTINIPDAENFTLPNGLKVFVVRNTKLPQVSATLTIDKLAIQEGSKAGMASMAGTLMRYGTTKMAKEKLDEEIDFLGGSISSGPLSVYASSLSGNFPKLFALMADVALRPAFAPANLEKVRTQELSNLESNKDDPSAISQNISHALLYGKNHPYGEIETPESVKGVTIADIKQFYTTNWKPNAAYLVFVGDITLASAKSLATQYFGAWPKATIAKEAYAQPVPPAKTYVAIVDRPNSVQSVIDIVTPIQLQPGTPDAIPVSVMNTILGGGFSSRLMQNLREKYAFTYGARSSLSTDRLVGRFSANASVRNEKTDSAIGQFLYEIGRIQNETAKEEEVTSLKNYMSGGFARSLEQPATIANFALNIARYNLPKDYYRNYLTNLAAVGPQKVGEVAKKYLGAPMIITIVGNAKEIAPGLEKYGEVKYFDMFGNPVSAPETKTVDPSVTGESILKKAVAASGGQAALDAIKDVTITGKMGVMGQEMEYTQKSVMPAGFVMQVKMQGMTVMQQKKVGTSYTVSQMGQEAPVPDAMKAQMDEQAYVVSEAYILKQSGNTYTVKGIEKLDGKDVYVLHIKTAGGDESTAYYDVKTGLKAQDIRQADAGPMGKMNITTKYGDYKTYGGITIPSKVTIDQGELKPEITVTEVKINQGLTEADLNK